MSEIGIDTTSNGKVASLRDSDSQVSRATVGLRKMLLRGEFLPGQRIAEIPLSAKLGVSRTPLRLAFERLEHEGLIRALPNSGFAAREFSILDIWDALETRGVLEGAAARLAAERLQNSADLEPLRSIERAAEDLLRMEAEEFGNRYLDLNDAFHSQIWALSGNKVLQRALEQVSRLPFAAPSSGVLLYKSIPATHESIRIAREAHQAIIEAIEHREGARAEALAREHARLPLRNLEIAFANPSYLEAIPGGRLIKLENRHRI